MTEEVVSPQEEQPQVEEQAAPEVEEQAQESAKTAPEEMEQEEKQVPLTALQKERKKRQEAEMRLEWEREQRQAPASPPEEDDSQYESATKADLNKVQQEAVRQVEEKLWVKNNLDKYEQVNEYLPEFLKQRPNLAYAINSATNRYEEAWTLMNALSPKEQKQVKAATQVQKRDAPGSPTSVPKAAAMNQAVDVMSMDDKEFAQWRKAQRRRR